MYMLFNVDKNDHIILHMHFCSLCLLSCPHGFEHRWQIWCRKHYLTS